METEQHRLVGETLRLLKKVGYMDFLCEQTVRLKFDDTLVVVPHPIRFALLKLIVAAKRTKSVKRVNDERQASQVIQALIQTGEEQQLEQAFDSIPDKWQQTIRQTCVRMHEIGVIRWGEVVHPERLELPTV